MADEEGAGDADKKVDMPEGIPERTVVPEKPVDLEYHVSGPFHRGCVGCQVLVQFRSIEKMRGRMCGSCISEGLMRVCLLVMGE